MVIFLGKDLSISFRNQIEKRMNEISIVPFHLFLHFPNVQSDQHAEEKKEKSSKKTFFDLISFFLPEVLKRDQKSPEEIHLEMCNER